MSAGGRKRKEHVKVTAEEPSTKVVVKNLDDVGAKSQYFPPDKWKVSVEMYFDSKFSIKIITNYHGMTPHRLFMGTSLK